jgi:hypothetical protein
MNNHERWFLRLSLLSELVGQSSTKLGRTAVMKLAFLLQIVKGLPLGYDFRLYTYGPFDSDVLNDLGFAESLGAVESQMVTFPSGYGYEFTPGPQRQTVTSWASSELSKYQNDIRWALEEFGGQAAADLELIATIIYADREAARQRQFLPPEELGRRVKEVKPHFTEDYILQTIKSLADKRLLVACNPSASVTNQSLPSGGIPD